MSDGGLRGADLARLFHTEVVGPWLARELPGLRYAAGRLGSGSDVLGLDDGTSRDHDWGCRLVLLVDEPDAGVAPRLSERLEGELPETYRGFPVRFPVTWGRLAFAPGRGGDRGRVCRRPAGRGPPVPVGA